jgi:hypothetical protein
MNNNHVTKEDIEGLYEIGRQNPRVVKHLARASAFLATRQFNHARVELRRAEILLDIA